MRLGLASTLLHNSGFFGYDLVGAASIPTWFDEYAVNENGIAEKSLSAKHYLGQPLGSAIEQVADDFEVIFNVDFEAANPIPDGVYPPSPFEVSDSPEETIDGTKSAIFEQPVENPLPLLLMAIEGSEHFEFEVGEYYQLSLAYRVLELRGTPEKNILSVTMTDDNNSPNNADQTGSVWHADIGQLDFLRTGLLVEQQDTSAFVSLPTPGRMAIDNLVLTKGATAFNTNFGLDPFNRRRVDSRLFIFIVRQ